MVDGIEEWLHELSFRELSPRLPQEMLLRIMDRIVFHQNSYVEALTISTLETVLEIGLLKR